MDEMNEASEVCCDVCEENLMEDTLCCCIGSGYVDSFWVEGPVEEMIYLCPECDAAITAFIQRLRNEKRGG